MANSSLAITDCSSSFVYTKMWAQQTTNKHSLSPDHMKHHRLTKPQQLFSQPPPIPTLSHTNLPHTRLNYLVQIHLNIIIPPNLPGSGERSLSFRVTYQKCVSIAPLPWALHTLPTSLFDFVILMFDEEHKSWSSVPLSLPPCSSPEHPLAEHPQCKFLTRRTRPDFVRSDRTASIS